MSDLAIEFLINRISDNELNNILKVGNIKIRGFSKNSKMSPKKREISEAKLLEDLTKTRQIFKKYQEKVSNECSYEIFWLDVEDVLKCIENEEFEISRVIKDLIIGKSNTIIEDLAKYYKSEEGTVVQLNTTREENGKQSKLEMLQRESNICCIVARISTIEKLQLTTRKIQLIEYSMLESLEAIDKVIVAYYDVPFSEVLNFEEKFNTSELAQTIEVEKATSYDELIRIVNSEGGI